MDDENHYGEGFITSDPSLGTTGESQNDHCQATSKIDRYDGANRFSDLTYIRQQLPDGWQIEAASSGFALTHDGPLLMSQLWETFSLNRSVFL